VLAHYSTGHVDVSEQARSVGRHVPICLQVSLVGRTAGTEACVCPADLGRVPDVHHDASFVCRFHFRFFRFHVPTYYLWKAMAKQRYRYRK
jgi:hypothetical protein